MDTSNIIEIQIRDISDEYHKGLAADIPKLNNALVMGKDPGELFAGIQMLMEDPDIQNIFYQMMPKKIILSLPKDQEQL